MIDDTDAFINKFGCPAGYLVLVIIGIGIIQCYQRIQEIQPPAYMGIVVVQSYNGGLFTGRFGRQIFLAYLSG